ncbi:MAG: TfoX/Sxy family protein [Oscillospiraceae bacterium]|nr:TfoX/Sxy family protein [Oscillospiraceae bacterium]
MSTSKSYLEYILDGLSELEDITYKAMMGEYIIYYKGKIAAYLCDDRLLAKPVEAAKRILAENGREFRYEAPYEGAKPMLLVEETDNREFLCRLFKEMYSELPQPKPKKAKKSNNSHTL